MTLPINQIICGDNGETIKARLGVANGVTCPFCNEDGFDLYGLKLHLTVAGWCDKFHRVEDNACGQTCDGNSALLDWS